MLLFGGSTLKKKGHAFEGNVRFELEDAPSRRDISRFHGMLDIDSSHGLDTKFGSYRLMRNSCRREWDETETNQRRTCMKFQARIELFFRSTVPLY